MARYTSILLGERFKNFITKEVASGRYRSASDVVRTALKLLEATETKYPLLSKVLSAGEKSGLEKNFDPKTHLKKLHNR